MPEYERDPQNYDGRSLIWDGGAALPKRSLSAEMVAALRAAHQQLDDPVVHIDPLAFRIIGAEGRRWLEENPSVQDIAWVRATRTMLATRCRISEEELRRSVERGTTQYVVLGAGLDTSAYRLPEFADRLTVFEVDEPGTQAWKLERLKEGGIPIPDNLCFVSVDFNEGTLAAALAAAGFDRAAPAFFSWLGVSYYLPMESILDTMRFVAGHEAPSFAVLDIALEESAVRPEARDHHRYFKDAMLKTAEPWQTWLAPQAFRDMLLDLGFTAVEVIDSNDAMERFGGQCDMPSMLAIVTARKR
jgi:methyltransferase (TIGR00027 family)